jgi:hypothetical protein
MIERLTEIGRFMEMNVEKTKVIGTHPQDRL